MQKRTSRKAGRGGEALLTGLVRCGRCGRMMRVFYGVQSGHAHRYQCRGDDAHVGAGLCIGHWNETSRPPVTTPLSPHDVTNWWIQPNVTSPENWKHAGTQHWSALCRSSDALRILMLPRRHGQTWIAMP